MKKQFYAASNSYGTNFTYSSDGWFVHVFDSKQKRDEWVNSDPYPNGNPSRETITAAQAPRIRDRERWIYQ